MATLDKSILRRKLGTQLGGEAVDLVMVVLNNKGMQELVSGKMILGIETSVTAGPTGNHEWNTNEKNGARKWQ